MNRDLRKLIITCVICLPLVLCGCKSEEQRAAEIDPSDLTGVRVVFMAERGIYETGTPEEIFGSPRICDELLYPVFEKGADTAEIRLLCSSDDRTHMLTVKFPGIDTDPLGAPYLDEINVKILEHNAKDVFSRKADNGYKVCFNL